MLRKIQKKIRSWQHPNPVSQELILNRHRIYILPSKAGLVYALVLLTIFITSINYNLNLGYALDFVLISCGWLGINFTFRNLSGIGLTASPSPAVYLGDMAHFSVHLNNRAKHARYAINIGFSDAPAQCADIPQHSTADLTLATPTTQRGWMACPRIRIQTTFPYGLLNAWSYWNTTQKILVYPAPEINPPALPFGTGGSTGTDLVAGNDDFSGVRNYKLGDPLKQLAWRQIARQSASGNEVLISKHFEGGQQKICLLDLAALPPQLDLEQKLSRLCAWLLAAEREQVSYAFKLGQMQIPKNSGADHQAACLTALALFGQQTV
ncbi:uncharacterized protein (DUF58 family) [Oxalobacteraceae bacterium GrIS 2.11]